MGKITIWMPVAWVFAIGMIAVLMLTGTAMGEISRTGLVAEWHFDGDAKDSSGNGIDGTIYGATFVDGKLGKALALNGINDNVDFGTGGGRLDFGTGDFSIEFWMEYQGTTVHPNFTYVMGKTAAGTSFPGFFSALSTWGAAGKDYTIGIDTTTSPLWNNGAAVTGGTYGGGIYYPNTWYHVVFVRYGNTWTIYTTGISSASVTNDNVGLNVNNDVSFNIGKSFDPNNPNGNDFKGLIDEVRIYNRALSANEVKANYEAGQIIITSSPPGAEVLVDSVSKGSASPALSVYGVSPGTHTVKCKLSGYSDYDTNVVLTATGVAFVSCSLTLITPNSSTPTSTPLPTAPLPTPTPSLTAISTTPTATTPSPMPTQIDTSKIVEDELKKLSTGRILFNPPQEMDIGKMERIEVRLTKTLTENLTNGTIGRGEPQIENIRVGTFMKVRLIGDNFYIKELSDEEQIVSSEGFTPWEFDVMPLESGTQKLQLAVAARIKISNDGEEKIDYPVLEKQINVKVNPGYTVGKFFEINWQYILTTFIGLSAGILGWIIKNKRKSGKKK